MESVFTLLWRIFLLIKKSKMINSFNRFIALLTTKKKKEENKQISPSV